MVDNEVVDIKGFLVHQMVDDTKTTCVDIFKTSNSWKNLNVDTCAKILEGFEI